VQLIHAVDPLTLSIMTFAWTITTKPHSFLADKISVSMHEGRQHSNENTGPRAKHLRVLQGNMLKRQKSVSDVKKGATKRV